LQSPSFELAWDPQQGTFHLESPGRFLEGVPGIEFVQGRRVRTVVATELAAGRVLQDEIEDVHGQAHEMRVHYQEVMGLALSLRVRLYPNRPFVQFRLSVTNVGTDRVKLRRFFVRTAPDGLMCTESPSGFFGNGWQSWSPAGWLPAGAHGFRPAWPVRYFQGPVIHNARTPWKVNGDRFWSETVGAVVTPREALIGGASSLADQFVQMSADLRPGHLGVVVQSQLDDVPLDIGESRHSEWFYFEWVPLPNPDPFAQYAYAVARQMDAASPRQIPTGWTSWHVYGYDVGESDVMENLASAALLADELPLNVLQIDEGYQTMWGDWSTRNERFPHALTWLADRIKGSGFRPGLWMAPLVAHTRSRLAQEHPEWLLRGIRRQTAGIRLTSRFKGRALDPTHPGVADFLQTLVDTVVNTWGYRYIKLDFLYAAALGGQYHKPQMTRAQALRHVLEVVRDAAGPEIFLAASGTPLGPAVGLVDAMRVGPGTAAAWKPGWRHIGAITKENQALPGLRNSLRNVTTRGWMHGRWWSNDPDALLLAEAQSELTEDEVKAQITLTGLSGGQVFLSDDLDDIAPERRALAAVIFPQILDGMDVLDLLETAMPEVVMVPVARPWGRWRLIGLFNWGEEPVERELPASIPLSERKAYHVVDFWDRRYFLMGSGGMRPVLHIPPHGVVLLSLRPVKPDPHLVATTFHISQGGEVTAWSAHEGVAEISISLGRLAEGAVWLDLPSRPQAAFLNDAPLPDRAIRAVASGIWSVTCRINRTATLRVTWSDA
jgi:alpha-galactosidase